MKLAGLLTESQVFEAPATTSSSLEESIKYFTEVKLIMERLCKDMLSALESVDDEDSADDVVWVFEDIAIDLVQMDSSFENFYEWWTNDELGYGRKVFRNLDQYKDYFRNLKSDMIPLLTQVIQALTTIKTKGSAATETDRRRPRKIFSSKVDDILSIDNSLEDWTEWCLKNLFKNLI